MGKRDARYEFIRVISMFLVIGLHSFAAISPTYADDSLGGMLLSRIVFLCNGLFFMISGRFALTTCCRTGEAYRKYYLKRLGSIGIPVLFAMLLRSMFNVGSWWPEYFLSVDFLKEYLQNVLHHFSSYEYWFLYRLVGFLVLAPFAGKMLQQASRMELLLLVGIGMLWNVLQVYLPVLGISFAWSFPLDGWFVLFALGYAIERIVQTKREENILMILGCISFAVSILLHRVGLGAGVNDLAPTYAITTAAAFVALKRVYRPGRKKDAVVLFLGGLTMSVYLLHMMVLYSVLPYIPQWSFCPRSVVLILATASLTMLLGFVLERTLLAGLQWGYRKLVGLK